MNKHSRLTYLFILSVSVLTVSCKKGDTGPQGPQGNANVTQYEFGVQNLNTAFSQLQITTTQDTMDHCTWLVYLYYEPLTRWYFVPGYGAGGATNYRVSMSYSSGKVNIYIDKTGPGEAYAKARVSRIYNKNVITNGKIGTAPQWEDFPAQIK